MEEQVESVSYSCPAFNSSLPQTQLTNAQDTPCVKKKFIITQYNFSLIITKTYRNGSAQDYNETLLKVSDSFSETLCFWSLSESRY